MYKISKNKHLSEGENLKRYRFPEIPIENDPALTKDLEGNNSFCRVPYEAPYQDKDELITGILNPGKAEKLKKEIERIEKEAYFQGLTQGEREGIELGKKKIEPILQNFHQALLEVEKIKKKIYLSAEKELVELALAIAKKVIAHEIKTNKESIKKIIKEALKQVAGSKKIKIKLGQDDFEFVKNAKSSFLGINDSIESIDFEADENITGGGCIIETNFGEIDASIEKQLQVVEETLRSEIEKREVR